MSLLQGAAFRLLDASLARFVKQGRLTLIDADGARHVYGEAGPPTAAIRLRERRLYAPLLFNPELAAGEAYMDGALVPEDGSVADLLELFHLNAALQTQPPLKRLWLEIQRKTRRLHQHNPIMRARRNAAHHYDLSNDLYRLFLDRDLNYSCAYYEWDGQSLDEAQRAKNRRIAAKLRIEPGMRVLDIGCGWGALAIYLAKHLGAEVIGITLSKEQCALAAERAAAAGVADRTAFHLKDYREIEGRFDRIVSVGMFEHVGAPHYRTFFAALRALLNDDGVALVHSIGRKGPPDITGPWIRKYIFPGGYIPALSETFAAIEHSGLWACDVEILRLHYAETLREWRRRFEQNRDKAAAMFDERFCRMWEFYLASSEFAFRRGGHMVFQIQLAKTVDAVPLRRDYIDRSAQRLGESERRHAAPAAASAS